MLFGVAAAGGLFDIELLGSPGLIDPVLVIHFSVINGRLAALLGRYRVSNGLMLLGLLLLGII